MKDKYKTICAADWLIRITAVGAFVLTVDQSMCCSIFPCHLCYCRNGLKTCLYTVSLRRENRSSKFNSNALTLLVDRKNNQQISCTGHWFLQQCYFDCFFLSFLKVFFYLVFVAAQCMSLYHFCNLHDSLYWKLFVYNNVKE